MHSKTTNAPLLTPLIFSSSSRLHLLFLSLLPRIPWFFLFFFCVLSLSSFHLLIFLLPCHALSPVCLICLPVVSLCFALLLFFYISFILFSPSSTFVTFHLMHTYFPSCYFLFSTIFSFFYPSLKIICVLFFLFLLFFIPFFFLAPITFNLLFSFAASKHRVIPLPTETVVFSTSKAHFRNPDVVLFTT